MKTKCFVSKWIRAYNVGPVRILKNISNKNNCKRKQIVYRQGNICTQTCHRCAKSSAQVFVIMNKDVYLKTFHAHLSNTNIHTPFYKYIKIFSYLHLVACSCKFNRASFSACLWSSNASATCWVLVKSFCNTCQR